MGAPTQPKRFQESRKLLDFGFNNFEKKPIVQAKMEIADQKTVPIKKGKDLEVGVVTETGIDYIVKKGDKMEPTYRIELADETVRTAPVKAGTPLGKAIVLYDNKEIGTINLVAAADAEKAGWFSLLMRSIGSFFGNLLNSAK